MSEHCVPALGRGGQYQHIMLSRQRRGAPGSQEQLRAARRAFSLIEVVLVAALAAGLFLLSIQYVVGLVDSSESAVEGSGVRREATLATEALTSELRRARLCDPYGLDAPFREVTPKRIEFYVDVNGDRVLDVVAYQVADLGNGPTLQRAEVLALPPTTGAQPPRCGQLASPGAYTDVAQSVAELPGTDAPGSPPFLPVFEPLRQGKVALLPDGTYDARCNTESFQAQPERCLFDGVHVQLVVRSGGRQDIPVNVDETIPVSLQGSRL